MIIHSFHDYLDRNYEIDYITQLQLSVSYHGLSSLKVNHNQFKSNQTNNQEIV